MPEWSSMSGVASKMTPGDYGRMLAEQAPPLTDAQVVAAARILASVAVEQSDQ